MILYLIVPFEEFFIELGNLMPFIFDKSFICLIGMFLSPWKKLRSSSWQRHCDTRPGEIRRKLHKRRKNLNTMQTISKLPCQLIWCPGERWYSPLNSGQPRIHISWLHGIKPYSLGDIARKLAVVAVTGSFRIMQTLTAWFFEATPLLPPCIFSWVHTLLGHTQDMWVLGRSRAS